MQLAVLKRRVARQVILRRLAVLHGRHGIMDARLRQHVLEQHHVRLFVFHIEDGGWVHPGWSAALNSTQNRLPRSGSDSNPTRPPIFSTALRTTVSPTPVPS